MKIKISLAIISVFFHLKVFAQSENLQDKYKNGKELFKMGKYRLALQAFEPVTQDPEENPFAPYASFFYALSAYHADLDYQAKSMLLQIKSKFPDWEKLDEVNLWLGRLYFEDNKYNQALSTLNHIKTNEIKDNAAKMKLHYLHNINDIDSLKHYLEEYPDDKSIAKVIADRIIEQPVINRDVEYLEKLISEYDLKEDVYGVVKPAKSLKKDKYKVAVLFPFMYEQFTTVSNQQKNFVYELYEGIVLAKEDLQRENVDIELYAYDTRKNANHLENILDQPEMKGMDLIVGPLLSETIELVTDFSYENKINMVNPVSSNSKIIGNNPYSFLFLPSVETQGQKAAEFAMDSFSLRNNRVMIYYGESEKDYLLAHNYKMVLEDNGYDIVTMRKVYREEAKNIYQFLTGVTEVGDKEELTIAKDSIGHIFVAADADDGMIAANIISAVETRGDNIQIIGLEDWLDFSFIIPEQLERLGVCMISPSFIDITSENYERFRQNYIEFAHRLPSKYVALGYEMMSFFGHLMNEYGAFFQVSFDEMGFRQGDLMPGYKYNGSNDNQYVPIIRFIDSELKNVNAVK